MVHHCHCCHQRRGEDETVVCCGTSTGRRHAWCTRCIRRWLKQSPQLARDPDARWQCPKCNGGVCPCPGCRRSRRQPALWAGDDDGSDDFASVEPAGLSSQQTPCPAPSTQRRGDASSLDPNERAADASAPRSARPTRRKRPPGPDLPATPVRDVLSALRSPHAQSPRATPASAVSAHEGPFAGFLFVSPSQSPASHAVPTPARADAAAGSHGEVRSSRLSPGSPSLPSSGPPPTPERVAPRRPPVRRHPRPQPAHRIKLAALQGPAQLWTRRRPDWEPPPSPWGFLQEELWREPWKVLVACMLLNQTTGAAVRDVIWRLFEAVPDPERAVQVDAAVIEGIIRPLGLFRKRSADIQRMSREFMHAPWTDVGQLHGVGKYASDAYKMFVEGRWRELAPDDKELKKYHEWLVATGGQGTGLRREAG